MTELDLEAPRLDYKNPDYTQIIKERFDRLQLIRSGKHPQLLQAMKIHYRDHPADFINDWGYTFEPRNIAKRLIADIPFIVWPRQRQYLEWVMERWMSEEQGLVEKSRDCGVTWLSVGFAASQWCFRDDYVCGFGSQKLEKVDHLGDSSCIFEKFRHFIYHLPPEFMPEGFNRRVHDGRGKILNPDNNASIIGEGGDEIGRGGRSSMYFVDEAAFIQRQLKVDNALSMNTTCQIDISTYNGSGNPFYEKSMKFENTRRKFVFDWRQDPRKDDVWYQKMKEEKDPVTVAQEIDRDPHASSEDVFIPSKWVNAAIDLHELIQVYPSGLRVTAFDPADEGDPKGIANRYGYVVTSAELKKDGDITDAIPWAYNHSFKNRSDIFLYDADGMGAPTMKFALKGRAAGRTEIVGFYGSGSVQDPERIYGERDDEEYDTTLRMNKDMFMNLRAQAATELRDRFENAYEVRKQIENGGVCLNLDVGRIISISSKCKELNLLVAELSRPKRKTGANGKIKVESKQEMRSRGVKSPTFFDVLIMVFNAKVRSIKRKRKSRVVQRRSADPGVM